MRSSNDSSSILKAVTNVNNKITTDKDDLADWGNVGKSLDKRKDKTDIEKWTPLDFGKMVSNFVHNKTGMWIGCGPAKYAENIKKLNTLIKEGIGSKPEKQLIKDYLIYALETNLDPILSRRNGYFDFQYLVDKKIVDKFLKNYQPTKEVAAVIIEEKKDAATLSANDVQTEYDISVQSLILSYGLIVSTNYLAKKDKISTEQACKQIADECIEMCSVNSKFLINIIKATEKYSPYPKWLPFLACGQIMDDVCKAIGKTKPLSVKIVDDDKKFGFLR